MRRTRGEWPEVFVRPGGRGSWLSLTPTHSKGLLLGDPRLPSRRLYNEEYHARFKDFIPF